MECRNFKPQSCNERITQRWEVDNDDMLCQLVRVYTARGPQRADGSVTLSSFIIHARIACSRGNRQYCLGYPLDCLRYQWAPSGQCSECLPKRNNIAPRTIKLSGGGHVVRVHACRMDRELIQHPG